MRFGLHSGQHHVAFSELLALWKDAAAWGFDACYVFDHFLPLLSDVESFLPEEADRPDGPCLEATVALAALARAVPRVGVGVMVAGVGYRAPGLFVHTARTLEQAAGPGRLELGIGAGWFEPEYRAFGLPFPSAGERMDQLEVALDALAAARREGLPVRVWVAGTGEKRLLPLAARFADSWNAMYVTPEEFGAKVDVLRARCADLGRQGSEMELSIALRAFCAPDSAAARTALEEQARRRGRDPERLAARSLAGSPAECVAQLARYVEAGATHLAVMVHPPYDREGLALLTNEVFPAFR
jgi:alkanesulfonate monooxygenase SsuD/methylene tetrahydromethanopterin reductase-like flavin-dependent oxidoreductase (luciferase family)